MKAYDDWPEFPVPAHNQHDAIAFFYSQSTEIVGSSCGHFLHVQEREATLLAVAKEEYANASAALPLVDADSNLGWEPTMEYRGGTKTAEWKLRRMEDVYGVGAVIPQDAKYGFTFFRGNGEDGVDGTGSGGGGTHV